MHLPQLPTVFVKDGEERKAYHTIEAKELLAAGWVEAGALKAAPKKAVKQTEAVEEVASAEEKSRTVSAKATQVGATK